MFSLIVFVIFIVGLVKTIKWLREYFAPLMFALNKVRESEEYKRHSQQ